MIPLLMRLRRPGAADYNRAWSRPEPVLAGDADRTLMRSAIPKRTSAMDVDMENLDGRSPVMGIGLLRGGV